MGKLILNIKRRKVMAKKKSKSCGRCARCCVSLDLMLGAVPDDEKLLKGQMKWINLHHCNTWVRTSSAGKQLMVSVPISCVNMGYDIKTKKYFCRDYENRPEICKSYKCY